MKDEAPSGTALVVARNVTLIAATPELAHLVPLDAAEWAGRFIEASSPQGAALLMKLRQRWFRGLCRLAERCMIPGLALHQVLRKRHLERIVRRALAEGFEQVVVMGGGFDALPLRLHREFPAVNFLELDHPATQRAKKAVVDKFGGTGPSLRLAAVDLARQPLDGVLASFAEYQSDKKTVLLCEGVLMYLTTEQVGRIFEALRRLSAPAVRFIFTAMAPDQKGRAAFQHSTWLVKLWLFLAREPFRWGLAPTGAAEFLEGRGFSLLELATDETFRAAEGGTNFDGFRIAQGEFVAVADRCAANA